MAVPVWYPVVETLASVLSTFNKSAPAVLVWYPVAETSASVLSTFNILVVHTIFAPLETSLITIFPMSLINNTTTLTADALAFSEVFEAAHQLGKYAWALFSFYIQANQSVLVSLPLPLIVLYDLDFHSIYRVLNWF